MAGEAIVQQISEPQPWVRALRGPNKDAYERFRQENIEEYKEVFVSRLGELITRATDFDDVESLIDEAATRLAVGMRNTFEAGIQIGKDDARRSNYRPPHDDMPVVPL